MTEPIVMIAMPTEDVAKPIEKRYVRISVMTADAQQTNVQRDQRVTERGKTKPAISCAENDETGKTVKDFQPPRQSIVRLPARPGEDNKNKEEQDEVRRRDASHDFFRANSTASLIAAIMLSGRAIPLPAIGKAVPWSGLVRGNGKPSVTFTPP